MELVYRVVQGAETFHAVERDGEVWRAKPVDGSICRGYVLGAPLPGGLGGVRILAPVEPSKVVCVGLNYRDHVLETGKPLPADPLLFMKPPTAVIGPGAPILLPPGVGRIDYEGEAAVVIGRRAHRVQAANAWDYVFGWTCLNDVTARDLQNKDSQYTRCKGFDTFAPMGPSIAVGLGREPRTVETWVNGRRRQASSTAQLIFGVEALIEFITFVMTLEPGDVISTGTPAGIGAVAHGDVVTVKVGGVGELTSPVQHE